MPSRAATTEDGFIFNGFVGANLSLDGFASITSNGLLRLTNGTSQKKGHAFLPTPINFKSRDGKATTSTDVFAFGAFLLEVASGRRPIEPEGRGEQLVLMDWVLEIRHKGSIVEARDPRLGEDYSEDEMEMVLKLGLLCYHPVPAVRPSMHQVMQFLDGHAALPELSPAYLSFGVLAMLQNEGLDNFIMSYPSSMASITGLMGGR